MAKKIGEVKVAASAKKGAPTVLENARDNVGAILAMERAELDARSTAERFSDALAKHAGRLWFIVAHAIFFAAWIVLNLHSFPGFEPFDPFPYQFLTFVVSLEAIFLSLFILMSQNRSNRQADQRSHLDLQIDLLAEQESTKMLIMLHSLCKFHNLPCANDPELEKLEMTTEPEKLLKELQHNMSSNC